MERTARLVRIALATLPTTPDPWQRGAADVAAAVGRSGAQVAGGAGGCYGRELAHAVGRAGDASGREGAHAVVGKEKGAKLGQGEEVGCSLRGLAGSRATGPGRGLSLAASPLTRDNDSHGAPLPSQLGQGERVVKEAAGGNDPARYSSAALSSPAVACSSISEMVHPLVLHDKDWLFSKEGLGDDGSTQVDVSQIITSLLRKHMGPVCSFRIDSSRWTDSKCLNDWIDVLSEKSVEELILLNLGHKVTSIFPIQNLQSKNLRFLRLGFLTINLDLHCFNYNALQMLDLFCCTVESNKLSWIVTDCVSLKELRVQYSFVDLSIRSSSLEVLRSVGNTGNRILIESAPKLSCFVSEIIPRQKCAVEKQKIRASISINNVPSLKLIKHLTLPFHKITINKMDITKEIGLLPSVVQLDLSLEMVKASQLRNLRKLLESFPMLQELCVQRMDSVGCDEGFDIIIDKPFDDIDMVDSVKKCLTTFSLLDFRGGPSERHLIQSILKNAPNLMLLRTSRSEVSSKRCVREASREIRNYDRMSESCVLTFE